MNCVHGIDDRFCAVCNRTRYSKPRNALGDVSLDEVLQFLNHENVRATYGAVADVLGVIPRSMGARLGTRRPEASWIVSAANGLPTDYSEAEWHPALLSQPDIISSGQMLALRSSKWTSATRKT